MRSCGGSVPRRFCARAWSRPLIAEGIRILDFPAEPYQWEEQWTDTLRWHVSVLVFNRTPRAVLYRLLVGLRDLSRRSQDAKGVQYVDPRKPAGSLGR